MFLGLAGVLAAGMSIVAAFGLVSACGMSFVSIVGNVPFLLIGNYCFACKIMFKRKRLTIFNFVL